MAERLQKVTHTFIDNDGKTREEVSEFDEQGAKVQGDVVATIPEGELPADFPGRDIFRRAGYGNIEALRQFRRRGPFTRIEGIDSLTAQAAEFQLASTPEDDAKASEATAADAKATKLNTKVSTGGGGGEAESAAPPLPGPVPQGKPGTGEISAQADASVVVDGEAAPAAGHGKEGFIVGAGEGSHTTTSLSQADGATKVAGSPDEGEGGDQKRELKGKFPDGFPGKVALDAADPPIHTFNQLSKFADDYTAIPGIGDKTAEKIQEWIANPPAEEE